MRWFARFALLPGGLARDVVFEVEAGVFTAVSPNAASDNAGLLPGVVLPGLANGHSHAFHRALRGRTHDGGGTFWTWRQRMYALAGRLDPDSYFALARAVFAEMALAGITSVGEFHYLHHASGGRRYDDPNAMGRALVAAARDAGVRLTLLDTCYLVGGVAGEPLAAEQLRFSDGDVEAWADRVRTLRDDDGVRHAVAVHSVRAVPRPALAVVAEVAAGRPLHVHLSEQPDENEACLAVHGVTPTRLLADEGVLGPFTTAVHAVHLEPADIDLLASSGTTVCLCPSTEHDLADGIAPAAELRGAGVAMSLGSDQHVAIDLFGEAQRLEGDQRAISLQRGRLSPIELLAQMTRHASLGWDNAGRLEVGARADLVAVRLDTVRTAGIDPAQVVLAASAADVDTVVADGQVVVRSGVHRGGDVGRLLRDAIEPLWVGA
jgi:formiminoglutamate deiminase